MAEMQQELEFSEEKDKDFRVLEALAEEEADTISKLERENCKAIMLTNIVFISSKIK